MRRIYFLLIALGTLFSFTACKDIIAEDITNRIPVLIVPSLNDTVMQNPVQFKWEAMDGATKYHLQVVSPSFSVISDYVIDTVIYGTTFNFALDSSEFELKLTALNGGYTSQTLGPIKFWVGISPTVNTSSVVLTSPANGIDTNATFNGPFEWQILPGATTYEFSLRKGTSFATGVPQDFQNNLGTTTYSLPSSVVLSEGTYYWGVKAYLSSGETIFTTRSFDVDDTDPLTPTLISPTNGSLLSTGSIDFTWSTGADGGTVNSPIHSVVQVATDAGFTDVVHSDDIIGNSTSFTIDPGTYYWRVYNYDEAGNVSFYSTVNQIILS